MIIYIYIHLYTFKLIYIKLYKYIYIYILKVANNTYTNLKRKKIFLSVIQILISYLDIT